MRTGRTYGPLQTGPRRRIQQAIADAADGDVIQISPGAIWSENADGAAYPQPCMLLINKSVTLTNIPGQGRWSLAPSDIPYVDGRSGVVIANPGAFPGANARKTVVISGFDFWNWGRAGGDHGIRMRTDSGATSWSGYIQSVTIRDFKLGKHPYHSSGSGISGAAETLIIEDGHVFDTGAPYNIGPGQDHNCYISGRNIRLSRVISERTRHHDATGIRMDGHILKVFGVNILLEDCQFIGRSSADNSAVIQFYGGGNCVVRNCHIEQCPNPSNANGCIWYDWEKKNVTWFFGEAGHSLTIENCTFLSHHAQPLVFIRNAPPSHPSLGTVPLSSPPTIAGNTGRVISLPPQNWISGASPAIDWREKNVALPYEKKQGSLPAWRQAMTEINRLYAIGDPPSVLDGKQIWPPGVTENTVTLFGGHSGQASTSIKVHYGYGGSVFAEDLGPCGTMIFGGTGEMQFNNQLTRFTLSDDAPTWDILQQPRFATTAAGAAAIGADCYFNPAEYAALPANRKIVETQAFADSWDRQFPVGWRSWIIPDKPNVWTTGHNAPHAFRYNMPAYLPASVMGNKTGGIVVNTRSFQGPFRFGYRPRFICPPDSDFFADCWPNGNKKRRIHVLDLDNNQWTLVTQPIPDFADSFAQIVQPFAFTDKAAGRVYYTAHVGRATCLYYVDFTSGVASATISKPIPLTQTSPGSWGFTTGSNGVFTNGHPTGRKLYYTLMAKEPSSLIMIDVAARTVHLLRSLPGFAVMPNAFHGFGYDAATNRIVITARRASEVRSFVFEVPKDPTSASNYSVTATTLALAEPLENIQNVWQYGQRNEYIPKLGVVLMTQRDGRMLAYRPY